MKRFSLAILAFCALFCAPSFVQAQRVCGSSEHLHDQLQQNPALQLNMEEIEKFTNQYIADNPVQAGDRAVITIPVVWHVVWNVNNPTQNISDAQIASQMTVLNEDFRKLNADAAQIPAEFLPVASDYEIEFCMAVRDPNGNATTGIERKSSTVTNWGTNDNVKFLSSGGFNAWAAGSYLNMWVCQIGNGILGYAQFPGGNANTDGVVCDWRYIGTTGTATPPFDKGRTATHEVGHWLNLRHIWGDANCGNDLVGDTPIHTNANYACPAYPTNSTCGGNSHAMMTMNYMDYTDDACMYMFSTGQKTRSWALFAAGGARASLPNSQGCVPPDGGGSCGVPTNLVATAITQTSATLGWAAVANATDYNLQWKLSAGSTWTTVTAIATNSYNLTGLTAATSYDFKVQTNCSGVASAYSTAVSFTTQSAGGGNCTETNEPNNTRQTAAAITPGTAKVSQISTATDKDYWKFANTSALKNIKVDLTTLPADYDLKLYRSSTLLATSQNSGSLSEQIIYNTNTVSTAYVAYVYGYNGAFSNTQCYNLLVSLKSTAWRTDGTTNDEAEEQIMLEATFENAGFGLFPNPANDLVTVEIPTESEGQASVSLLDLTGKTIATQSRLVEKGDNRFVFPLDQLANGFYLVQVRQGEQAVTRKLTVHR